MEKEYPPLIYSINRILDCGFSVEEVVNIDQEGIQIGYGMNFVFSEEENWIQYTIRTDFKNANNESFFTGTVLTRFGIENFNQFINEQGQVVFPSGFLEMLFGISFSHMRAILAKNISGSKFSTLVVPIINPKELFNNLLKLNIEKFKEFAESVGSQTPIPDSPVAFATTKRKKSKK